MRRMTKVSPYPYWHFFDAYPPGYLRAVYRGNGIPLPWGNLAQVSDPCPNWAVFRMIDGNRGETSGSQISVLRDGERSLLYCCNSQRVRDMAGNPMYCQSGWTWPRRSTPTGAIPRRLVESILKECLHRRGGRQDSQGRCTSIARSGERVEYRVGRRRTFTARAIICPRSTRCPASRTLRRRASLARSRNRGCSR